MAGLTVPMPIHKPYTVRFMKSFRHILFAGGAALMLSTTLSAAEMDSLPNGEVRPSAFANIVEKISEKIQLSGFFQSGYTGVLSGNVPLSGMTKGYNTLDVKRLCFTVRANLTEELQVVYQGDFSYGYKLLDFYATYMPVKEFGIVFGQMKTPLTIENQLPPFLVETINLAAPITNYLASLDPSNTLNGSQSGRDFGFMLKGDLFRGNLLGYKIGLFNGQGINVRDLDKNKLFTGALTLRPLRGLEVQGSFMTGKLTAVGPAVFEAGGKRVAAGETISRDRWAAGAAYTGSGWALRGEYIWGKDDASVSDGFYLTGKATLLKNFDLVASYSHASYNRTEPGRLEVDTYIAGLNYWFLPKCRLQVEYNVNDPKGSGSASHAILAQLQFAF